MVKAMKQFKVKSSTLKKGFFCLFVPLMVTKQLHAQLSGYLYGKTITIQGSKITGPVTNFPVLISFTDANLKSTGNGGHVQSTSGYDIIFTLNDCSTILPMQIERYVPATGEYVAWVKLPSLTNAVNKTIYMFYDKTGVTTDPSTTAVWDANYLGVYHFNSSVNDATSNARNLTDNGTANLASGSSKIGEGRRLANGPGPVFVASNSASLKYLQVPSNTFSAVTNFTFEGWVWLDDVTTSWERIFDFGKNTNVNMFLCPSIAATAGGIKRFAITTGGNGAEQQVSSGSGTGAGAWHYYAVTINAGTNTGSLYYDGAFDVSNTSVTLRPSSLATDNSNYFGRSQYNADDGLYGNFDEFRISNTVRNASWIATSYNNQNSPATFYTVSSETAGSVLCSVLPLTITAFEATPAQNGLVTIAWTVQEEKDTEKYIVERSANGTNWEAIQTITAVGNAGASQKYVTKDLNPVYPVSYYRLKQVSTGNVITYSQTVTAKLDGNITTSFVASPNPARQLVNITFRENALSQNIRVELLSNVGSRIPVQPEFNGNTMTMKLPVLANGIYFLNVYNKGNKESRKLLIVQ
jgi:biopolymer transport protein ExbB